MVGELDEATKSENKSSPRPPFSVLLEERVTVLYNITIVIPDDVIEREETDKKRESGFRIVG